MATEKEPLMPIETPTAVGVEAQLEMLGAMLRIRAFELAANQLYLSAKMPGLTHLYIGEEAVAVGCGVRKVGSCGESVFVEESAEPVMALDGGVRWVQHPQLAGRGIGWLQVE